MSCVLGIDLSSNAIDLVILDETTNKGTWLRCDLRGKTFFERLRAVPAAMPRWGFYEDQGVYLAAIETPKTRFMPSAAALFPVYGAVIACLPRALPVWDVHPTAWRQTLGLAGNATKQAVADAVHAIDDDSPDPIWEWPQDALDAYAIARYARDTNAAGITAGA